jgi:replicative DNA helicase
MTNGLQPGDLIILGARPSMGKTALACGASFHGSIWSQREMMTDIEARRLLAPCLIFSMEMSTLQLMERALAAESRLPLSDLRSAAPGWLESDFRSLVAAADRISLGKFAIDDRAALSLPEMKAAGLRWRKDRDLWPDPETLERRHRAAYEYAKDNRDSDAGAAAKACAATQVNGLVMVDYLQLAIGGKARYGSRQEEISEISRGLKAMAKELKVPVLALSQLNRDVDSRSDHRPQLSDLRESGAIEQDADVIMFIYREERYLPADAPEEKIRAVENKAEAIFGKQRNGPIGTVPLYFNGRTTSFADVEERF